MNNYYFEKIISFWAYIDARQNKYSVRFNILFRNQLWLIFLKPKYFTIDLYYRKGNHEHCPAHFFIESKFMRNSSPCWILYEERKKKIWGDSAQISMNLAYSTSGLSFYSPTVLPYKITSKCGARTTPDEDNGIWPLLSAFLCHYFYLTWFSDPLPTAPSVLSLTNIYRLYILSPNWIMFSYQWIAIFLNPICFFGNFFLFSCL